MTYGIYLLLGTNLGDKLQHLEEAKKRLGKRLMITRQSSVYETAAWGNTDQPTFYNQVIQVQCDDDADTLLHHALEIETLMGRQRTQKWGARIIDIDLLYFDDLIVNKKNLIVPHPGIPERKFTLVPLVELAPGFIHPVTKKTNQQMLARLDDELMVKKLF